MAGEKLLALAVGLVATHVAIENRERIADWVSKINSKAGHNVRVALQLGAEVEHGAADFAKGFFEQELQARRPTSNPTTPTE